MLRKKYAEFRKEFNNLKNLQQLGYYYDWEKEGYRNKQTSEKWLMHFYKQQILVQS